MPKNVPNKHHSGRWSRFLEESSFLRHYLWKYRRWVTIGLIALVIVDVIEIFPPIFLKKTVDVIVDHRPIQVLAQMAMAYLGISLVQGICRYGWRMYLIRASIFSGCDLREKYAHHLFSLSSSFFDRTPIGNLMSLATSDVEAVRIAIGTGLLVLADAFFYLLTIPVAMFFLSPKLTLLVSLPLPLIPFIVLRNENAIHERFEKVQECFGDISSIIQENLNGIRVIKGFGREDTQINRVREEGEKYVQLNRQLAKIQTFMGPALDLIMSLGMLLLLFFGGRSLIQDGERLITLGTFVAFQRYIQKMIWPMTAVGMAVSYYQRSISSSDRLKNIFSVSTDVPSPLNSAPLSPKTQGKIEFRNLTFKFPDSGFSAREKLTLSGINLVVEPGERVAFVGAIGAGKSAILALVPRLYPVQNGMLWIDGVDINHWPIQELRKRVGYVGQDVFLFSESIFENIAFGLHEQVLQGGAQTMVEQAAGIACVHDEIRGLPWGYQTRLGERGLNLSGGQKQRLTIARALAKQPPILVLDDALSSVDVHTEEKILQSLKVRSGKNTELISSHRISTIQNADQIVVLREGRVVQKGTHAQLMQFRGGEYWRFYEQQQLKEDLENYQNDLH